MTEPAHTYFQERRLLLAAATGIVALAAAKPLRADTFAWKQEDAERLGIANDLATRLDEGVKKGELVNLHAVVVVRRGKLALERYYEGADERWGTPLGKVSFNATTLHDLRSVSKSIVGLLYGIALAEGKVPALDAPVLDEDLPYTDPRNSEIAMERSFDRYQYVLEQPIVAPPGQKWRYSGGATAILGHLIAKGTGLSLLEFARTRLFSPMGIEAAEWTPGSNGEAAAASGLRMRAADLARVGQLMLQRGEWGGRSLVPSDWIAACLTPHATAFEGLQYGYHWYMAARPDGSLATMAIGLGGQRLVVIPSLDLAYVILMGNYRRADQVQSTLAVQRLIGASIR